METGDGRFEIDIKRGRPLCAMDAPNISGSRSLMCTARQGPGCPQLVRIGLLLGFVAARDINQAFAFGVTVGSLPGRGRSSSAADAP
jgi:hypothetical protein